MMQKKHKRINILKSFALAGAVLVLFGQSPRAYSSNTYENTSTYDELLRHSSFNRCLDEQDAITENHVSRCGDRVVRELREPGPDQSIDALQGIRRATEADLARGTNTPFVRGLSQLTTSTLADLNVIDQEERARVQNHISASAQNQSRSITSSGGGNANQCPIQVAALPTSTHTLSSNPAKWGGHNRFDQCLEWAGQDRKSGGDYPLSGFASKIATSHLPYREAHSRMKNYYNAQNNQSAEAQCLDRVQKAFDTFVQRFRNVTLCMSLFHMLPSQNFEDDDMTTRNSVTTKSGDGKIQCRSQGVLTKDYQQCKKVINTYNAALIANVGLQGYQALEQDHSMNKATQRIMEDESASTTGALQVQEEQLRKTADHTFQRALFHGAKGATLYTLARQIPDHEDVYNVCMHSGLESDLSSAQDYFHNLLNTVEYQEGHPNPNPQIKQQLRALKEKRREQIAKMAEQEEACRYTVYQRHGLNFLVMNSQAREGVMALTMEQAVQAGLNLAHQDMLKRQADQVRGAINRIEDFNPTPPPVAYDELMLTACEHDPTLPECLPTSGGRQNVMRDGDQFTFGGFGGGTSGARTNNDMDPDFEYDAGPGRNFDRNQDPLVGSSIAGQGGSGGLGNTPGAGSAEYGEGGGSGGGGGAGVGGASAPAGGGAAGHDAEGRQNAGRAVAAGNEPTFDGGSGFRLGGGAGLSRVRRNNNESSDNPFSNLFGEDRRSGEVLNYRNPAELGGKNGSIFQMISTRYQNVSQQDRLIEYETRP